MKLLVTKNLETNKQNKKQSLPIKYSRAISTESFKQSLMLIDGSGVV